MTPPVTTSVTISPAADLSVEAQKTNRELKREATAAYARRQQIRRTAIWAVAGLVALVLVGLMVSEIARPKPGEAVSVLPSAPHIQQGTIGRYNSNPPASGLHLGQIATQGFFNQAPADELLVHNLEHGYIIVSYDCSKLDDAGCTQLKTQLGTLISKIPVSSRTGKNKMIGTPREGLDAPIVLTSWGRIQKLDTFDETAIRAFAAEWMEKSPEPGAA